MVLKGQYAGLSRFRILAFFALALSVVSGCKNQDMKTFDWQGHRGARGERPENTISAFKYALEQGVKTLELDVVISSDSMVVVSHEPFFNHEICTGFSDSLNNIFKLPYSEIQTVDCGSKKNPRFPDQRNERVSKPLLAEVIKQSESYADQLGRSKPLYNIEIKSRHEWDEIYHPAIDVYAELVLDVIKDAAIDERYTIQSFDNRTLKYLHKAYPYVTLVLLVEDDKSLQQHLDELGFVPEVYSPYYKLVNTELVKEAHREGMKVIPWTVNEKEEMQEMIDAGVDGIITDYPSRSK